MPRPPRTSELVEPAFGLLYAAILCTVVAGAPRVENDVFWHLAIGRQILDHGFPRTDPFAFSTDAIAWSPPEWLSEVVMYGAHAVGGLVALAIVRVCLLATLGALLWTRARTLGAGPLAALVVLAVASSPASVHLPMRPLLVGHVLCAVVLDQLARLRAGRRHLVAWLPLAFLFWANVHPSWPLGLAFLALALVAGVALPRLGLSARLGLGGTALPAADARTLAIALGLSCLAPLGRPDTLEGALYPFVHLVGLGAQADEIIEWFPLSPTDPLHVATVLGLALVLAALVRTRASRDGFDLLVVVLVTALCLRYQRFLPLVTIAVGPIAASLVPPRSRLARWSPPGPMPTVAGAAALVVFAVALPDGQTLRADVEAHYPAREVAWVRAHGLAERAFNTFEHGGYLLWVLPERRVYVDSRFDLYARAGVFQEYLRLRRGEDVLEILDARHIDAAILPASEVDENFTRMTDTLRGAGWTVATQGRTATVLLRPPVPE